MWSHSTATTATAADPLCAFKSLKQTRQKKTKENKNRFTNISSDRQTKHQKRFQENFFWIFLPLS